MKYTIKNGNKFLYAYSTEKEEIDWADDKNKAFWMSKEHAEIRLTIVKRYFPKAIVYKE